MSGGAAFGLLGLAIICAFFTVWEVRNGSSIRRAMVANLATLGIACPVYLLTAWVLGR